MRIRNRVGPLVLTIAWLTCLCSAAAAQANHDPLEGYNRKMFWFNNQVDHYVLKPVATGWSKITPERLRQSVSNFFQNLRFPVVVLNDLLQLKLKDTGSDIGRFAVNTSVGVLGFFDPASGWGLAAHDEDFGQTLGYWGVPSGPYLVLPFFGPSDPRDTVGLAADSFSTVYPYFVAWEYTFGANGMNVINGRAQVLKEVDQFKQASLDYYVAVRNAYLQRREALVHDRSGMSEQEQQDLYNVDTGNGE